MILRVLQLFLAGVLILSIAYFVMEVSNSPSEDIPNYNVILITVDAVRADHLGSYSYVKDTSPNIDRLAEKGLLFEDAISQASWTRPAIYSLMTGKYINHIGYVGFFEETFRDSDLTIPEILQEEGFFTMGFTNHPALAPETGIARGFDNYTYSSGYHDSLEQGWLNDFEFWDVVLDGLNENHDKRFFMYAHILGAHGPYVLDNESFFDRDCLGNVSYEEMDYMMKHLSMEMFDFDELVVNRTVCMYDSRIKQTDYLIGLLVNKMENLGLFNNTIFILTTDHGEELFEHDIFGHDVSLYNPVLKIPLIIHVPDLGVGLRVREKVQLVDVMPTLLDLLDIRHDLVLSGRSLLPLFEGGNWSERAVISERFENPFLNWSTSFFDEGNTLFVGNVVCYNPNITACVTNLEKYRWFDVDLSRYPQQIELSYPDQKIGFFKCDDEYMFLMAFLFTSSSNSQENFTRYFREYMDSAMCGEFNNSADRHVIGNFSIKMPTGKEFFWTQHTFAVFWDNWKYLYSASGLEELYDLSEDSGETENLVFEYPELVEMLREQYKSYVNITLDLPIQSNMNTTPISEEMIEKLVELGYLTI
jgi:arylsulfatase A-like enzyme